MYFQYAPELQPLNKWGCYFASLGKIAETCTGRELTPEEIMNTYAEAVCSRAMDWDCFIKKPDALLYLLLHELGEHDHAVNYIGWWNADMHGSSPEYWHNWKQSDMTHMVLRFRYNGAYHFRLPGWDPYPGLQLGPVTGKRLFRVELAA